MSVSMKGEVTMTPLPPWMIEELERRREERDEQDRPVLHIVDFPVGPRGEYDEEQQPVSREPIVIEF